MTGEAAKPFIRAKCRERPKKEREKKEKIQRARNENGLRGGKKEDQRRA